MNDLSVNNTAHSGVMPESNISRSDETEAPEIYSTAGDTKYAIKKRKTKISKATLLKITLSVSAVSGSVLIANVFIGSAPTINNFDTCYQITGTTFEYNLEVEVVTARLEMSILKEDKVLKDYVFESSGTYTGEYILEKDGSDYEVKFYSTNLFDYKVELTDYNIKILF